MLHGNRPIAGFYPFISLVELREGTLVIRCSELEPPYHQIYMLQRPTVNMNEYDYVEPTDIVVSVVSCSFLLA